MKPIQLFLRSALLVLLTVGLAGQTPESSQPSQAQPQVRGTSIEVKAVSVLIDVIVRDAKGDSVVDLQQQDFRVFEDGVEQKVDSFYLVQSDETRALLRPTSRPDVPGPTKDEPEEISAGDVSFTAMVFDRLTPEGRSLAREAALGFVDEYVTDDSRVGLFLSGLSLQTLALYTSDRAVLRSGIEQFAGMSTSGYESGNAQVRDLATRTERLAESTSSQEGATGPGASPVSGADIAEQMAAEMNMRMLETFEVLQRDQQGYATVNGLMAVVNSMSTLPGRKTIMFFSEGIALPAAVEAKFRSVISAANRANVSIYPVDAAGLRLEGTGVEAAREINSLGRRRTNQAFSGREDTSGPMTKYLERNEDLLRLDAHTGLNDLADQTGGFLIRDTNNLDPGLQQINQDMHTYYMLSYTPSNTNYDGKFRRIEVKVPRPRLTVQARKGYFAVDAVTEEPLLDYEAPAITSLSGKTRPSDFHVGGGAYSFPESRRPGFSVIVAEVPRGTIGYGPGRSDKFLESDFAVVALIRDNSGRIVQKLSQQYLLGRSKDSAGEVNDNILFYRETDLIQGRYEVDFVAYDAVNAKAGSARALLEVHDSSSQQPRLSSVLMIRAAEQLGDGEYRAENPFHFGEIIVYPNLGESISKTTSPQVPFYFTAYVEPGAAPPPVTMEILQGNKRLGEVSISLPAPDAQGRVQYASALPLSGFAPGSYELRITVGQGKKAMSRSCDFTVGS